MGDEQTSDSDSVSGSPVRRGRLAPLILGAVAVLLVGLGLGVGLGSWLGSSDDADDIPASNSAAVGFAQDMIRHHEQGIQMAALELNNGSDPQVKSLAYDILTTQANEVGQMQSWLTRWGYPIVNPGEPMAWMGHSHDMSAMPGMSTTSSSGAHDHDSMSGEPTSAAASATEPPMPGMATESEMAKLRTLKGRDSDVYFMQLMLRHHQGGEHMMAYAADPANVSQDYVRALASTMLRTQGNEIKTLQSMLAGYGAPQLPMN